MLLVDHETVGSCLATSGSLKKALTIFQERQNGCPNHVFSPHRAGNPDHSQDLPARDEIGFVKASDSVFRRKWAENLGNLHQPLRVGLHCWDEIGRRPPERARHDAISHHGVCEHAETLIQVLKYKREDKVRPRRRHFRAWHATETPYLPLPSKLGGQETANCFHWA